MNSKQKDLYDSISEDDQEVIERVLEEIINFGDGKGQCQVDDPLVDRYHNRAQCPSIQGTDTTTKITANDLCRACAKNSVRDYLDCLGLLNPPTSNDS